MPEWIYYGQSYRDFRNEGLNNPGTQVEMDDLGEIERILIGDTNIQGGGCDCCAELHSGQTIKRYRVLVTKEQLNGD